MERGRNGTWFLAALAAAAIALTGTGTARAGDTLENFELTTENNLVLLSAGPAGTDSLMNGAGLTYDWGAYNAASGVGQIRYNQGSPPSLPSGFQVRNGAAVPGSYFLTRFDSGDSAVVNNLKRVNVTENQTDFQAGLLVRDSATGDWHLSETVSLVDTQSFDVETLQWAPVTNADTAIEAAIGAGAPNFSALTIGTLGAWPAGLDVNGGGIYFPTDNGTNACRIGKIEWKEPAARVEMWKDY